MLYFSKLKESSSLLKWLVVFLALEISSYLVWLEPELGWIFLLVIALAVVSLLYRRSDFFLYIPLAEIFWGSLGHSIDYHFISLRLLIFVLVLSIFVIRYFKKLSSLKIFEDKRLFYNYLILLVIIFLTALWGYFRQGNLANVFYDGNAYLYILYLPIWYQFYDNSYLGHIFSILKSATLLIAVKTLLLLNVFSQNYNFLNLDYIYKWVRDTRTGEITPFKDSFFRIFMQSQFYLIVAWFYFFFNKIKNNFWFLAFVSAAIYVSLSRSFWLGTFIALILVLINIFVRQKKISINIFKKFFLLGLASVLLVQIFYNIPQYKNVNIFTQRSADSSEAALSSRSQLWQPMWQTIGQSPATGHGFGKEITFRSSDPRIKNDSNPEGWHSTYAFEWGWMDQLVKGGFLLVITFVAWIALLYNRMYSNLAKEPFLAWSFIAILSSLVIIHIFSPYINHPLGLSVIMLISVVFPPHESKTQSYN